MVCVRACLTIDIYVVLRMTITRSYAGSRAAEADSFKLTLEDLLATEVFDDAANQGPRAGLAGVMLDEVSLMQVGPNIPNRLVWMLQHALRANDRTAVVVIWDKIAPHSTDLVLRNCTTVWGAAMFQWLVFYVRRPRLVLWLVKQGRLANTATAAMVASIMHALHGLAGSLPFEEQVATHTAALLKLPHDGRTWWTALLEEMITALPLRPTPLWVQTSVKAGDQCHTHTAFQSLLVVAVGCSELSPKPMRDVLNRCKCSSAALTSAWAAALRPEVLRGDTMLDVLTELYVQLLPRSQRFVYNDLAVSALESAWRRVVESATGWQHVRVAFATSGVVRVPRALDRAGLRHPEVFVEVIDMMLRVHQLHLDVAVQSVQKLIPHALEVALPYPEKTHLVEKLLQLLSVSDLEEFIRFPASKFLNNILEKHIRLYPVVEKLIMTEEAGARVVKDCWLVQVKSALGSRILNGDRDATKALVTTLDKSLATVLTASMLLDYITGMCVWSCNAVLERRQGDDVTRAFCEATKRDLGEFLRFGMFEPAALQAALQCASENRCGVAVEVLVSPPFNAQMQGDDPFVHHILQELFAPGAKLVLDVGKEFSKRQRTSL